MFKATDDILTNIEKIEGLLEGFTDFFEKVPDHRVNRNKLYTVSEIFFLTLTAVICGSEGWEDIENFGKSKINFLRKYFPYTNGIPSDDTLRRFFRYLNPEKFREIFVDWVKSIPIEGDLHIAIDGKVSRHTFDTNCKINPLHMVTAFASNVGLVLAQEKVKDKSNEIKAIPKLLELIDLPGSIITIDAMGCQREISQMICQKEADYVLSLKGNQGSLHQDVMDLYKDHKLVEELGVCIYKCQEDNKHGRLEERICKGITIPEALKEKHNWPGIKSMLEVTSIREVNGKRSEEKRYYISSLENDAEKLSKIVRSHWSIENSLHWVMDVSFGDDDSRIRKGNAANNMSIVKHLSINLLKLAKGKRDSMKGMRKRAGWDDDLLSKVLSGLGSIE